MRGEQSSLSATYGAFVGSSPHARGTGCGELGLPGELGIIPACAGNSLRGPMTRCPKRDHPRMRGEQVQPGMRDLWAGGSSPHARGTAERRHLRRSLRGIIPACAGNSAPNQAGRGTNRDHPRMRGEQELSRYRHELNEGSSPHARGTVELLLQVLRGEGIIPACAGNRSRACRMPPRRWDHPRMRGEQQMIRETYLDFGGSSPHARGTEIRPEAR